MTDRSVYAINSGPASAPQAGLFVAAPFKKKNVITVDMGGTSFDITLTQGRHDQSQQEHRLPALSHRRADDPGRDARRRRRLDRLDRQPGTAAGRAATRRLRARARPATARAGREPTVSDANLVLGYLNPEGLLGGKLPLDLEKARKAIKKRRRSARHVGRARRLWHVHHRQQQHGERHPPRVGGARL